MCRAFCVSRVCSCELFVCQVSEAVGLSILHSLTGLLLLTGDWESLLFRREIETCCIMARSQMVDRMRSIRRSCRRDDMLLRQDLLQTARNHHCDDDEKLHASSIASSSKNGKIREMRGGSFWSDCILWVFSSILTSTGAAFP